MSSRKFYIRQRLDRTDKSIGSFCKDRLAGSFSGGEYCKGGLGLVGAIIHMTRYGDNNDDVKGTDGGKYGFR